MKELNTAVYGKEDQSTVVTITRQESPYLVHLLKLRGCAVHPGITFVVRARSDVNYYLMFDDCAGACVVTVDKIMPPDDATRNESERWKETMSYKRAFRTDEAVMYSKAGKARGCTWATIISASYWQKKPKWIRTNTADPTRRIM